MRGGGRGPRVQRGRSRVAPPPTDKQNEGRKLTKHVHVGRRSGGGARVRGHPCLPKPQGAAPWGPGPLGPRSACVVPRSPEDAALPVPSRSAIG